MPRPIVDLSTLNLTEDVIPEEELRALLPHDHEFRIIDGICFHDLEENLTIGYKQWDDDPWWARGHIPGFPLMPGVLMIEGCAQVAAVLMKTKVGGWDREQFIGLGGVDKARFRGVVKPGSKMYFVARFGQQTSRLAKYPAQAICDNKVVFEMELMGVKL